MRLIDITMLLHDITCYPLYRHHQQVTRADQPNLWSPQWKMAVFGVNGPPDLAVTDAPFAIASLAVMPDKGPLQIGLVFD